MGKIHVLDERLANQIAAGEVVERPASVIKELVENSLDAGATKVEVQIDEGGVGRMTVIDDGAGMSADDAALCFSRHATSKIRDATDLLAIGTFGFRGEALAAIASVARVRLLTRPRDAETAHEVRIDAGRIAHIGEQGAPKGTRIDVEDLFFNTPVRRKFLKTLRTEAGHVEDAIAAAALGEPYVSFRLVVDGKVVLDVPAAPPDAPLTHPRRIERAVACLGNHVRPMLFPVDAKGDVIGLSGYVVAPLETRRDMAGVHVSVNRRPVSDRGLSQAVRLAFRTLLEVGRQPIVALDVAIPHELVDVNVHPRKAEVRFADPRRVHGNIIRLLGDFLATTPWLKGPQRSHGTMPARTFLLQSGALLDAPGQASATHDVAHDATVGEALSADAPTENEAPVDDGMQAQRERIRAALARYGEGRPPNAKRLDDDVSATTTTWRAPAGTAPFVARAPAPTLLVPEAGVGGAGSFSRLRVVGQVTATYLILEAPDGMVVIDQHAAHERVVFERLRAGLGASTAPSQPLLLPVQIELSAKEMAALEDDDGVLLRYGLDVAPFGGRTALVKAVPPGLDGKKAEAITRDALAELAENGGTDALNARVDALCARLACHAAIRAGDKLSAEEIRALLTQLDAIDLGAHCPHGRPVVRTVRYSEMAAWFDRT
jgi:DNA mismatch repair protein MutL